MKLFKAWLFRRGDTKPDSHTLVDMEIRIPKVTVPQAAALRGMFEQMRRLGVIGSSRMVAFYSDGDGNYRPKPEYKFSDHAEIIARLPQEGIWDSAGNQWSIDFDSIAWSMHPARPHRGRRRGARGMSKLPTCSHGNDGIEPCVECGTEIERERDILSGIKPDTPDTSKEVVEQVLDRVTESAKQGCYGSPLPAHEFALREGAAMLRALSAERDDLEEALLIGAKKYLDAKARVAELREELVEAHGELNHRDGIHEPCMCRFCTEPSP